MCRTVENSAWETESCRSRAIRWRSSTARSPSCRFASASAARRPLALAHDRAQEERRERRHGDVELRAQRPVVDGLLEERPDVVGGDADRHARPRSRSTAWRPAARIGTPPRSAPGTPCRSPARRSRPRSRRARRPRRSGARPPRSGSRRHAATGSRAQASISGRTTSPPEVSPSHHVRQNVSASDAVDDAAGQHRQRAHGRADRRGGPERRRACRRPARLDPGRRAGRSAGGAAAPRR